jgi:hypothetical protein
MQLTLKPILAAPDGAGVVDLAGGLANNDGRKHQRSGEPYGPQLRPSAVVEPARQG